MRAPAKGRLRATLRELDRLVESLPDGACELLEQSGLLSSWRSQLETFVVGVEKVQGAAQIAQVAAQVLRHVKQARRAPR